MMSGKTLMKETLKTLVDKWGIKMENKKKNMQQINIELDAEVSSGEYANFVVVTHSPAEFVLDFTRILPGVPKAKVHSRIIMAPEHAKAFMNALSDNINKFESKNGKIRSTTNQRFENYPVKDVENSLPN